MTAFENLVHTPLASAAGWALFHSLWEGALAALALLAILLAVRSPRIRYAGACLMMLGVVAGFAFTLYRLLPAETKAAAAVARAIPPAAPDRSQSAAHMPLRVSIQDAVPWLAPFWIAGVVAFHLRSLAAWIAARRLRGRGVCRAPGQWEDRLRDLGARLQIARPVGLLESCLAEVPVVIGYWRPVILTPVGMLAGMSALQVEAILLHELAHIARRDYLINLLQTLAEGFLFYHPAIWWISGVIRAEREKCCDDAVVAASGDAAEYAAALTALERARWAANPAALAATGGKLVTRIRRLLYPNQRFALAPFLSAAVFALVAAGTFFAWQARLDAARPQQQTPAQLESKDTPYNKWLNEDVVYIIDPAERDAFLNLQTDSEREHFIEQFWLRRDPTPGTPENEFKEEHYRRIAYVNDRFGWPAQSGWRTDRGRIYIVYGPPDEIESHPKGRRAQGAAPARNYPFEDWRYRYIQDIGSNVIIEFADEDQTGEFKMTKDPNPQGGAVIRHN